jgi:bifunctional non-homologous end joining protein LigD
MAKAARPGKIFVDWSQNAHHKTTIAPYSLRAREAPTISTPVTWDEVNDCASGDLELRFEAPDVLARVEEMGDVFASVLTLEQELPRPSG